MALDPRFITEAQALITETIKDEVPTANVSGGSAVDIFFAKGASAVLAPVLQQQEAALTRRSLNDLDSLTDDDFDLIFENLLVQKQEGEKSRGFVNVFYSTRDQRNFQAGSRMSDEDGSLNWVTEADLTFAPSDHLIDQDSGDFFIRVPLIAEEAGEQYDADPGTINRFPGDTTGALRVNNPSSFVAGITADSKEESLVFAQRSVSTRTNLTADGAIFAAQEFFGTRLLDILVTGNGDSEMTRDLLYDMGPAALPRFATGRNAIGGTNLNEHIGGRLDTYIWFRHVNVAQQFIDLFADMRFNAFTASGSPTVVASFVPGTTGTVPVSGKLILEVGSSREETVIYDSFVLLAGVYTFTLALSTPTTFDHDVNAAVRVSNTGVIDISDTGQVKTRPLIQIKEVRTVDPVSFAVIGDPVPKVDASSRVPGWYISNRHEADSYSAKEIATLNIDEKRTAAGNPPLGASDGVASIVSGFTELASATTDFSGYQGRDLSVDVSGTLFTRTIIAVKGGGTTVVLSGNTTDIPAAGGYTFTVDDGAGNFNQFPVRITFNTHTEVQELQSFFDQSEKRVVTSNALVRGFLPVFIDFTMRFRGDGSVEEVRDSVLQVVQQAAGDIVGQETTALFDFSDLVNAAYENGLANYVETPFQVRARYRNPDGTETTRYVHPDGDTVNQLAVLVATGIGDQFIQTTRPASVDTFLVPAQGRLRLGGFALVPNQVVEYVAVVESGDDQIFVLKDGETTASVRPIGEQVTVHTLDFDPDTVITTGTITTERTQRPYFGEVLFEKLNA